MKSPIPKERLRVSNWSVQRLYNYAVNETVELRLLAVFQHVVDPTRVRTVADKNSAVTPLDLRPTVADKVFKGNSIEVRGQFNCTMNMPYSPNRTCAFRYASGSPEDMAKSGFPIH